MQFYSILISVLLWFPPGKWVPLGQTVEDGSKHSEFFIGNRWPPLRILMINAAIISETVLSDYVFSVDSGGIHSLALTPIFKSLLYSLHMRGQRRCFFEIHKEMIWCISTH